MEEYRIEITQTDITFLKVYDSIPMTVKVCSEHKAGRTENGLGGMLLEETPVEPYIKDFGIYGRAADYEKRFDISNRRFYIAYDGILPVGALTAAGKTPIINMLGGGDCVGVLWDICIEENYKRQCIGQRLFDTGRANAVKDGERQKIIESRNNNVPACKFYRKQSAKLSKMDMYVITAIRASAVRYGWCVYISLNVKKLLIRKNPYTSAKFSLKNVSVPLDKCEKL